VTAASSTGLAQRPRSASFDVFGGLASGTSAAPATQSTSGFGFINDSAKKTDGAFSFVADMMHS